ncbi:transporter associated domain-containing protein, partial [Streptomyces minutiscleroticus]
EGPYETLAGLIATELGRIPAVGDTVEVAGWRLRTGLPPRPTPSLPLRSRSCRPAARTAAGPPAECRVRARTRSPARSCRAPAPCAGARPPARPAPRGPAGRGSARR